MEVKLAKYAGYCYGVERALRLLDKSAESSQKPVSTLGPIIHNPQVVQHLKERGIHPIANISQARKGTVVIRSHGVDSKIIEKARKKNLEVIDATCPFVKKVHQRAYRLIKEGYFLVIIGDQDHPEMEGILSAARNALEEERRKEKDKDYPGIEGIQVKMQGRAIILSDVSDLPLALLYFSRFIEEKRKQKMGVIAQTTQSPEKFKTIVSELAVISEELKVYNTICDATIKTRTSALDLAKEVDVMIVVGGKNSANTKRLVELCKTISAPTHHIETADEINKTWFKGKKTVGVTGGSSTPKWALDEVVNKIKSL